MKQGMRNRPDHRLRYWVLVDRVFGNAVGRAAARRSIGPFLSEVEARVAARRLGQEAPTRYHVQQIPHRGFVIPKRTLDSGTFATIPELAPDHVAAVGLVAAMQEAL